jgi:ABC-type uncharacterized transport system auxiliary subunit
MLSAQSSSFSQRALLLGIFVAGAVICGAGCFGSSKAPRPRYYRLPIKPGDNPGARKLPVTLRIEEFDVAPAYDHLRLVYRISPYELRHYGFRQWVTKPGRLVADALREYALLSGRFSTVTEGPSPVADYTLRGKVECLEEVDKGKKWYAHLILSLRLIRVSDGRIVWQKRFDKQKRVKKRRPRYVIAGLTDLLGQAAAEMLNQTLAAIRRGGDSQ